MKFIRIRFLLMATALVRVAGPCAHAATETEECCKPETVAAVIPSPFSAKSLYQLEARYTDDSNRPFTLGALRGRAVVLTLFFSSCGGACPLLVADMRHIQAKLPAAMRARVAFVLVSFDTARDTPAVLAEYRKEHSLDGQWTLLHGDADSVRELAALLGAKYKQEADGGFSHSNLITILNPAGEIAHQRTGLKDGLDEATAALVAAVKN